MQMRTVTGIGRPLDPNYPTNRIIVIVALTVGLLGAIVQTVTGASLVAGALWGGGAAVTVFLAWALCRELDPDRDLSAFVAAAFATAGVFLWGQPDLVACFWLLLAVRTVNRTTGVKATVFDALGLLGLGALLTFQGNWGYGLVTALAFFLDNQLPAPHGQQIIFAPAATILAAAAAVLRGAPPFSPLFGLVALGLAALFVPVFLGSERLVSVADDTGERLDPTRVRAAQALALLAGLTAALWSGAAGLIALVPLWSAVLGASLYRLVAAR